MGALFTKLRSLWKSPITTTLILVVTTVGATGQYLMSSFDPCVAAIFAVLGTFTGCLYWNRWRGLGFVPFCYLLASGLSFIAVFRDDPDPLYPTFFLLGIAYGRLVRFLFSQPGSRWFAWLLIWWPAVILPLCSMATIAPGHFSAADIRTFAVILALLAVFTVFRLFRPAWELAVEPVLWVMYRVQRAGPAAVPANGPCIVIANHACWADPLFLAKVLQRPITPMMSARFYDVWFLRPLAKHVFHIIRVSEQHFRRRETPDEIHEAVAVLDRGECLILFPEGLLRRNEDQVLRRFGRGIWQILAARPSTPVFCCWIEGGWGSWCSYWNGKPTKNKRPDFRRPIGVAVPEPIQLNAELLSHHFTTRVHLMNRVLESRKLLGLPELPPVELPKDDDGS